MPYSIVQVVINDKPHPIHRQNLPYPYTLLFHLFHCILHQTLINANHITINNQHVITDLFLPQLYRI